MSLSQTHSQSQVQLPIWYRVWRRAAFVALLFFLGGILIAIPGILVAPSISSAATRSATEFHQSFILATGGMLVGMFLIGSILGAIVILVTAFVYLARRIRHNPIAHAGTKTRTLVLLVLLGGTICFVAVVLFGPVLGTVFMGNPYTLCALRLKVVVFEDSNNNGVRDQNELGVSRAAVSVAFENESALSPETLTRGSGRASAQTDASGLAVLSGAEFYCKTSSLSLLDHVQVIVKAPDVYQPTDVIQSSLYSMQWTSNPNVIYIALRKPI